MADFSREEPAWGTRPGQTTAHRDEAIPSWGTPSTDLLTADLIAVIEQRGFLTRRSYDLLARDGTVLGALAEQTSARNWIFGAVASSGFILSNASGQAIAQMHRPGSLGRSQFIVTGAGPSDVGTITKESTFSAPVFALRCAGGLVMRLAANSFASTDWELADASNDSIVYGRVTQEFAGLGGPFSGAQHFAVRLSPALTGASRLLAVMATAGLGYVRDGKRRR